jgi:hypothetical protein
MIGIDHTPAAHDSSPAATCDTLARMAEERCSKCGAVQAATAIACPACGWSSVAEALRIQRPDDSGSERFARLRREEGRDQIVFGATLLGIGGLITALTYALALGGPGIYVIAYGPMVAGGLRLVQGLAKQFD